jgi:hypothetical protein
MIIGTIENNNNLNSNIKNKIKNSGADQKIVIEKINAEINPDFNNEREMVIRKTDFVSERTFAINANKAAFELNNDLIRFLKGKENKISVIVESKGL